VIFNLGRDKFRSHIAVIQYLVWNCFGSLVRVNWYLVWKWYLNVHLRSIVCCMYLSSAIMWCARWLSSGCACWFNCSCSCHHLRWCTYCRSLNLLVDWSEGAFAIASLLYWWMSIVEVCSCTSGTVIVRCRVVPNSSMVFLLFFEFNCSADNESDTASHGPISICHQAWFCVDSEVDYCCSIWICQDCRGWVGIAFGIVTSSHWITDTDTELYLAL